MKNCIASALWLCLFTFPIMAQNVVISDLIELDVDGHYDIIGEFDHRILIYRENSNEIDFLAFDKQMQRLWSKKLEKAYDRSYTVGMVKQDTSYDLFLAYVQRDSSFIYHYSFNGAAELINEGKEIIRTEGARGRVYFESSRDGSKAVLFQMVDTRELQAVSYDITTGKLIWRSRIELEDRLRNDFLGLEVTDRGDAFLVMDKENQRFDRGDHYFQVLYFKKGGDSVAYHNIPFKNYLTQSAELEYDEMNQSLKISGYFTERNAIRAEGVFYLTFQPNRSDHEIILHPWNEDIKQSVYGPQGFSAEGIDYLTVKSIIPREDGGILVIGEIEKIYERRTGYSDRGIYNAASNWVDFIYEDLVLVSLHPDGAWHWSKVLHKRQFSQDDNAIFSSYFVFNLPSFIRIIYNDEISNNSTASAYEVFTDGTYSRSSILSTQYQKLQLRFQEAYQYSSTAMIVPSEYKGRLKLVHIQF